MSSVIASNPLVEAAIRNVPHLVFGAMQAVLARGHRVEIEGEDGRTLVSLAVPWDGALSSTLRSAGFRQSAPYGDYGHCTPPEMQGWYWERRPPSEVTAKARTFALLRDTDETGISGTGRVAEGVLFSNGRVALTWLTKHTSVSVYDSMDAVEAIHGHGGKTRVVFDEEVSR